MEEIELKILEINEAEIREALSTFAERVGPDRLLTTITFSNPYNNATVRIRKTGSDTVFTVKIPVPDPVFKVRKEIETRVDEGDLLTEQLEMLGFIPLMLQEKWRSSYRYHETEIVIDRYPDMPPYVEIEGPRDRIKDVVKKLGYHMDQTVTASVYELFTHYELDPSHLVFTESSDRNRP
jgi:adenylate cyclase class 2